MEGTVESSFDSLGTRKIRKFEKVNTKLEEKKKNERSKLR